jgi:protoheme IX farnesyltransferase
MTQEISTLKMVYEAAKVRLGFLIMACALAGIAVSPNQSLSTWQILVVGLAVLLSSASAGAFNQWYERDIDAKMKRTAKRHFVTGGLGTSVTWVWGICITTAIALIAAAVASNVLTAFYIFLGSFTYGVIYTIWLKKKTWLNIVVGGLAGSFAVMAGAAAMDASTAPAPIILAVVLFLWTPPHFWALAIACKDDYARAGVPMLPVVASESVATWTILLHAIPLVVLTLLLPLYGMGWIYLLCAAAGGGYFVWESIKLVKKPSIPQGWKTFAASIWQLGLLLVGAILDRLILS